MSDRLDDFEAKMRDTRNYLVKKFLSAVMHTSVWSVTNFKTKTDLEALLKIKTLSDKIEAELASELMVRNRHKKATNVKAYDNQPQERVVVEERMLAELAQTQYLDAQSEGSM